MEGLTVRRGGSNHPVLPHTVILPKFSNMKFLLPLFLIATQPLAALTIKIDYTYDTGNFFSTPERKAAIEGVAKFFGDLIQDNLLRIDAADFPSASWTANLTHPATGGTQTIANLVVAENTMIVYVGSRILSGSTLGVGGPGGLSASGFQPWFDRLRGRGSVGATLPESMKTDHSPWGGSITFDADSTWNFSQTQNLPGFNFVSVALHEMGHVLGIGTADSWQNRISGTTFTGPAALRSKGFAPAVQSPSGGHFSGTLTSPAFGSFGMAHGNVRPVLMLPSSTDDNVNLDVASDLDLAGLIDTGWQIRPPLVLTASSLKPTNVAFTWKSSSFLDYRVERSTNLQSFPGGSSTIAGTGLVQSWTDPAPPVLRAFYQLRTTTPATLAAVGPAPAIRASGRFMTDSAAPRFVTGCYDAVHEK